ncbi:MAG: amidohydrolase [Anaerolineales bacterium]|nr:amidohydrolase [Anaerolineales bacterium]
MKLLKNAQIHTLNPAQPAANALVIARQAPHLNRIIAIGQADKLEAEFGHLSQIEDLGGRVILPGLTDAHIHIRQYANALQAVNLFGLEKTPGLELLAARAAETPRGAWITAYGWSKDLWGDAPLSELDAALPEHPALLMGVSLHVSWANSTAMQAAGITPATPDPPKGVIEKDSAGKLTGLVYEAAIKLFDHLLPAPTDEAALKLFENAQQALWKMGITGIHDFDRVPCFITLQTLHNQGRLKIRVTKNLPVELLDTFIESGLRSGFGDDLLRIGSIKAFADGALGARTAAMLTPYDDNPNNSGMLMLDAEDLTEFGTKAVSGGFSLTVHAIGDAANHQMLNGFANIRRFERLNGLPHRRHRLEHVQVLHPDDFHRMNQLDLIASMQPIHATSDIEMAHFGWGDRARYAYAWQSLKSHRTRLAFGSDAPVDTPNPFAGLYAAITRRREDGFPGPEGWHPQERLNLADAIQAYTQGAAYAAGMEDRLGMLAPGYLADLIVLDEDPFHLHPEELQHLAPRDTMVGGEWVHRA